MARRVLSIMVVSFSSIGWANVDPDANLWTDTQNPSGDEVVPVVAYDPSNGRLYIDTTGINRADDTSLIGTRVGGDDVGFIAIVIPSPEPQTLHLEGLQNGTGTDWTARYFNAKTQFYGRTLFDQYLLPIGETDLATFAPGLTEADFGAVELGVNFEEGRAGTTIFGSVQFGSMFSDLGDFNGDGIYDCDDVDALSSEIAAGSSNLLFDLTGDALVNFDDLDEWLVIAGAANLSSRHPYLLGDANLDGDVDVSDFNVWHSNRWTSNSAYCSGDFNANGLIDVRDYNIWFVNKFQSAANFPIVPEPASLAVVCGVLPLITMLQRSESATFQKNRFTR